MDEERLLILKMLEQGKISAEEAQALLKALEDRESEEMQGLGGEKAAEGNADWEARIEELGRKAGEWGREVAESVARLAERVQEAVGQKLVPGLENLDEWVSAYKRRLYQKFPELIIDRQYRGRFVPKSAAPAAAESDSEKLAVLIRLATCNGSIKVTSTPEREYILRIHGRVRSEAQPGGISSGDPTGASSAAADPAAAVEARLDSLVRQALSDDGIQLELNSPPVASLHIELALPQEHRYQLELNSVNGMISVAGGGLRSSTTTVETVNGAVAVQGLVAEYVRAVTTNGGISLSDLQTKRGEASTTNGGISASLLSLNGDWQLVTCNGGISVSLLNQGYSPDSEQRKWRVRATNGSISVVCPSGVLPPILFRAQTGTGRVKVEAPAVIFRHVVREPRHHYVEGLLGAAAERGAAEAGPVGAESSEKFQLDLETVNGSIVLRQG
ncbi:MAG: DUF4097 family beta strand repeat protein [Limnochordales bacterium]|nr:DUF4097 family beta strand repeat protein [Limnochordales bacterium]